MFMLCSGCDDVVFLGLGKRNYTPGGNQARARRTGGGREGTKGEEVRGFRSGGIWLPKGVVMGEHRMLEGATRTIGQILGPFRKEFVRRRTESLRNGPLVNNGHNLPLPCARQNFPIKGIHFSCLLWSLTHV